MDTSLKAAREYIYNDRSWASTGKTLDARVNTCILRALRDLSGEVPEALVPEDKHIHVRKSIVSNAADVNAKIKSTSDFKVLQFVRSGTWVPTIDGTWDAIMHLEITDSDGRFRRRQCREWWLADGVYYVSIERPWFEVSQSTEYEFRIYQPEFFLQSNAIEVLTPMQLFDDSEQLIGHISSGTARREYLPDFRQRVQGRPTDFWRGRFFQLPSPTEAPVVESYVAATIDNANTKSNNYFLPWSGPAQAGKFEFCYTYAWGRKEQEWGESTGLFNDPVFESAPSPISEVFDHAVEFDVVNKDTSAADPVNFPPFANPNPAYKQARAIVIQTKNLEEMLDFVGNEAGIPVASSYTNPPSGAELRYGRSGIKIRIYVRRTALYRDYGPDASQFDDRSGTPFKIINAQHRLNRAESDGKFYLLAELNPLDQNTILAGLTSPAYRVSTFVWNGGTGPTDTAIAPDPTRQLVKTTGYYAYHIWPTPDQDYDIDAYILMQPKELVNDQDQVPIKQEAFSAFLELALAYMSRLDGVDQNSEVKHRTIYRQLVRRFRSQHGDNNGIVENRAWGDIRPRYRYGTFSEG
jgi:hypothetical protein